MCCEMESYEPSIALIADETSQLYGAFGLHPHYSSDYNDEVEAKLVKAMELPRTLAWGECGLDYHYNRSPHDVQQAAFTRQIKCAVAAKKPLVVHSRAAEADTIKIMREHLPKEWLIHLHCFTDRKEMAVTLLEHFPNLCVGFTGAVTFPGADANRENIAAVPLDRLLLETDGPFMAPVPLRGRIAHPGMIPLVAVTVAQVKGVSVEEVLTQTRKNVTKIYGI